WTSPENYGWVAASIELARAFAACGGRRIVAAGTCAEYDWSAGLCHEFDTPLVPRMPYGVCKDALRRILESLTEHAAISFAWGRIFFPYGPGEAAGRLVPSVIASLLDASDARCTHGRQVRDFVFIRDVAGALVALLDSEGRGPVNIGSGKAVSVREVVETIAENVGGRQHLQSGALPATDEPPLVAA